MEQLDRPAVSRTDPSRPAPATGRASPGFATGLHQYKQWVDGLAKAMADYQAWTEQQGLGEGEQELRVYELIESLKTDKVIVALVGEFSRGKTELLNALFFSEFKQRLLPSTAGRTTMCPTELRYDENEAPCIKLLPIETRKTALTISEYRHTPVHWTTLHILKPNSVEEVREALHEVTRTKKVHPQEAKELGLYHPDGNGTGPAPLTVDVPVWRHAIINYPNALLKQGLVVLDTPMSRFKFVSYAVDGSRTRLVIRLWRATVAASYLRRRGQSSLSPNSAITAGIRVSVAMTATMTTKMAPRLRLR